ncbi:hypothetical protein TEA_014525 [Camellia sinensis var. sinensis]|uniref:Uncharacterized protein n=1 Tax=Camellia sinensis var. sinensis TaxID=542762 RepID=A0A4S4DZP4_CAMSN|nr:hypothetical protein TEA_014525 [Camellia sinensis var. sinensis]
MLDATVMVSVKISVPNLRDGFRHFAPTECWIAFVGRDLSSFLCQPNWDKIVLTMMIFALQFFLVDISENKFPSLPLPDKSITKNWPIEAWGQQDYHCDNKKLKYYWRSIDALFGRKHGCRSRSRSVWFSFERSSSCDSLRGERRRTGEGRRTAGRSVFGSAVGGVPAVGRVSIGVGSGVAAAVAWCVGDDLQWVSSADNVGAAMSRSNIGVGVFRCWLWSLLGRTSSIGVGIGSCSSIGVDSSSGVVGVGIGSWELQQLRGGVGIGS